jgi:hypothetical protein
MQASGGSIFAWLSCSCDTSSQGQAGLSPQSAAGYGDQSLQVAGTYWTSISIRIGAYEAPGTNLWTRYAFLMDTTMKTLRARTYVSFTWMHPSLSRELVRPFCFTSTRNKLIIFHCKTAVPNVCTCNFLVTRCWLHLCQNKVLTSDGV